MSQYQVSNVNKNSCDSSGYVISIYKINKTLHDRLGYKFYLLVLTVYLIRSLRSLLRDTNSTRR